MLHLISQSPIEPAILHRIDPGDVVVFLENAVLRTLRQGGMQGMLTSLISNSRLCVLSGHIAERGVSPDELIEGFEVISYVELVGLTLNNAVIQSWT